MRRHVACDVCEADDWERVNTLKHFWFSCNECNSVFGERKDWNLFSLLPFAAPIKILNWVFRGKLGFLERTFLMTAPVLANQSWDYAQYAAKLESGSGLGAWEDALALELERLDALGVEYHGKRILCISGGPGIFPKALAADAEVVVTEFSSDAVAAMKEQLGLDAVQFDVNADRLEDVVTGKFDWIIALSMVNFCRDQKRFVCSLTNVLNEDGVVYISNDTASLGYMLTWQFTDYIPTTFVNNEAFLGYFHQQGRFGVARAWQNKYNSYRYRWGTGGWHNKINYIFRTPWWWFYGGIALLPWKNLNRKWWSNNHAYLLRRE